MQLAIREGTEQEAPAEAVHEHFRYQPALDGLRGLAVAAVLLHHQGFPQGWGEGGFLGVDVFFVLSGYLITSLLLIDHARTGHVISVRFWVRRARRLLPAMLVLLLIVAAYAVFIAEPYDLSQIRGSALATLFYVNNFWLMKPTNRYGPWLLSHTWSLSIEEQFYLVWPILLAVMMRFTRGGKAALLAMFGALAAVSVGLMSAFYAPDLGRSGLGTDARAHSLLVGAALAVAMLGWRGPATRRARVALEVAGIVAFGYLLAMLEFVDYYHSEWLYHGGYLLIAIASAVVIAASVQDGSPVVRRVLSVRPLAAIGIVSYGLYLYHWPIYLWLSAERVGFGGIVLFLVRIAVTAAVAIASYFLVERPIRGGNMSTRRLTWLGLTGTVVVVVVLLAATSGAEPVSNAATANFYRGVRAAAPADSVRVLVAGDATAFSFGDPTGGLHIGEGVAGATASVVACGIGTGRPLRAAGIGAAACDLWPTTYEKAVRYFDPDVSVLMLGSLTAFDRNVNGRTLRSETPAFADYLMRQLDRARTILTAKGAPLVILTTPCTVPKAVDPYARRVAWMNSVFQRYAAKHPDSVRVADYAGFICPNGSPRALPAGQTTRWDNGGPLTKAAADVTWRWIAQQPLIAARVRTAHGS